MDNREDFIIWQRSTLDSVVGSETRRAALVRLAATIEERMGDCSCIFFTPEDGLIVAEERHGPTIGDFDFCLRAALDGETAIREKPDLSEGLRRLGMASCWAVPVVDDDGRTLGAVIRCDPNAGPPTADDLAQSRLFADLALVVIELWPTAAKLRMGGDRLRSLSEHVPGMVYEVRMAPEGALKFDYVSNGIRDLFGVDPEVALRDIRSILDLTHPDDDARVMADVERSRATLQPWRCTFRIVVQGVVKWIRGHSVPRREPDGSVLWSGVIVDISLEKAVEQAIARDKETAEAATRAKTDFLAAASHDLRQPLQALRLMTAALPLYLEGLDGDNRTKATRILDNMERSLDSLAGLLNSVLDLSKLDAGAMRPELGAVAARDVLSRSCADVQAVADAKDLALIEVDTSVYLHSDPVLLKRMVDNLLSNAVRYTSEGRVLVGCRRRGPLAAIEVWDSGPGIPSRQLDYVFKEFAQLGTGDARGDRGLGLGLSIVRAIGRLLGHRVEVESWVGKGSVFRILVPVAAMPAAVAVSETPKPAPPRNAASRAILVVEDDAAAREALGLYLESQGFRVLTAESPEMALRRCREDGFAPDVVVTDYRFEGLSDTGLDLIKALEEVSGHVVPGVVVTGDTSRYRLREFRDRSVRHLHKPADSEHLLAVVLSLLEEASGG